MIARDREQRARQRRVAERLARRLLRDAFGTPSERTVALAPPLTLALMVAWMLGRSSRAPNGVRSGPGPGQRQAWSLATVVQHHAALSGLSDFC